MIYSVYLLSFTPKHFVMYTETARAAQITARLLSERFPGMTFGYKDGADFRHGDCPPSIRDSALSCEFQQLVGAEMVLEAEANPKDMPKWCAFQYRDGGVVAHSDRTPRAVEMSRRGFDVVQERAI